MLAKKRKMEADAAAEQAKLDNDLRQLDADVDKGSTGKGRKHMQRSGSRKSPSKKANGAESSSSNSHSDSNAMGRWEEQVQRRVMNGFRIPQ